MLDRPDTRSGPPIGAVKIVAAACGALYLLVAFLVVMRVQSGMVPGYALLAVVTALPVCAFLAFRYPMIFPFGLYVALVPFDALLQVSGGATVARIVAFATGGAMVLHAVLLRRAFVPRRSLLLWGAVALYMGFSLLWTSDTTVGIQVTMAVVQLFLLMAVLAMYPATPTEFKYGLALIVPCGVLSAMYAFSQYSAGKLAGSRVSLTTGHGVQLDFNYYGASFILPIALAIFYTLYGKSVAAKLAGGASSLFMFAGLLLTGSRGAFVAAAAMLVYFGVRSRYRAQVLTLVAAAAIVSAFFPAVYERFAHDPTNQQASASGRTFIWETGLHSLSDHWLFGNGIGSYENTYDRNFLDVYQASFQGWSRPSHSILVGSLSELGVVGLALVLAAWYASFRQMRVIPKSSPWYGLRIAFEAAILALFAMSLTIDPMYIKYIWLVHSLVLVFLNQADPHAIRLGARSRRPPLLARGRPLRAD